ncbi:MAG: DNA repair protein RadC, partial [Planctomycetota bacterium]|nr:DNA repair protein RadC [Planctomycetota bacterium]
AGLRGALATEITSVPGVGPVTAARIQASFVLGRRSVELVRERPGPYRSASDVFEYLGPRLAHKEKEVFYVLLLDSKNRLIRDEVVSVGTLTASLVHPREVFRPAIRAAAAAIIVAHNHPSSDPTPSREDIEVTARLRSAGELIGIPVLDHVIIGAGRYVSLAERGKLRGER